MEGAVSAKEPAEGSLCFKTKMAKSPVWDCHNSMSDNTENQALLAAGSTKETLPAFFLSEEGLGGLKGTASSVD